MRRQTGSRRSDSRSAPPSSAGTAADARRLMRARGIATLATVLRDSDGWPYASLVQVAADLDGSPLLLLSDLADHTRNLAGDQRVSLLFDGTAGTRNPLAAPRLTVLGRTRRGDAARQRDRYVARHPAARLYSSFKDFNVYAVEVERAHYVAGFARVQWIGARDLLLDRTAATALESCADAIVAQMNRDHQETVVSFANILLGLRGKGWRMTGIDPDGVDLRLNDTVVRVEFDSPVFDDASARDALARLAERARAVHLS